MSDEKINLWLELYTEILGDADDMSSKGFKNKSDELYAKAEGMKQALEIFGYTLVNDLYGDEEAIAIVEIGEEFGI